MTLLIYSPIFYYMDTDSIMPFGKKKGMRLKEISDGYFMKLYDSQKDKLPPELKKYIEENVPIIRFEKKRSEENNSGKKNF